MKPKWRTFICQLGVVVLGFIVGCFWADDSFEIQKLRAELNQVRTSQQTRAKRLPVVAATKGEGTFGHLIVNGRTNAPHVVNDRLARAKVTPEDMELTRALEERRSRGEFLLRDERPLFRKLREYDFESIVSDAKAKNAESYNRAVSELLTESASEVISRGPEVGLPDEYQTHLREYYAKKIQQKRDTLETVLKPRAHGRNSVTVPQNSSLHEIHGIRPPFGQHSIVGLLPSDHD